MLVRAVHAPPVGDTRQFGRQHAVRHNVRMHRFRGTDIWLGLLAVVVNVGLVVGVVLLTTGRPTIADPSPVIKTPSKTTTTTTQRPTTSTTTTAPTPRTPEALLASDAKVTIAVLGDQTSDGESEWVTAFSKLLAQDRKVTLNRLNPADPTTYTIKTSFGTAGPPTVVFNGSRADATADYATKRVPFLVPTTPDIVILNYGRNNSTGNVKKHLQNVASAVQTAYPSASILVTLQPPTRDDQDKKVRTAVAAWAASKKLRTLDVAKAFIGTGDPNAYVSAADPEVLNARGDALWGETVFRLLGGTIRLPDPAPTTTLPAPSTTSSSTLFPSPSSSSSSSSAPPPPASTTSSSSSSTPPPATDPAPTEPPPIIPTFTANPGPTRG